MPVFHTCDILSSILILVTTPAIVPSSILFHIDDDDQLSVALRSTVIFQHFLSLVCVISSFVLNAVVSTGEERRIQQFVRQWLFAGAGLLTLDAILFWIAMSISLTSDKHSQIVPPLFIVRCFQAIVVQVISERFEVNVYNFFTKLHQRLVFTGALMFLPVLCKWEVDKIVDKQQFGGDLLVVLIHFHLTLLKGLLLTAICLCFCSAEGINNFIVFRRSSQFKSFVHDAKYSPAGVFWLIFIVAVACLRLSDVWLVLCMLTIVHSLVLISLKEIMQIKQNQIAVVSDPHAIPGQEQNQPRNEHGPEQQTDDGNVLVISGSPNNFDSNQRTIMEEIARDNVEFNARLNRDEKEFWLRLETRHPEVHREWKRREEAKKKKIRAFTRKQEEKFIDMLMGERNVQRPPEDHFESAEDITEDRD